MGYLRDYLQFQAPSPSQMTYAGPTTPGLQPQQDDDFGDLLKAMQGYQSPPMPDITMPRRAPLPPRPQQSFWDLIPQLLAGAGDTINAGAGVRSDALGRTMGLQRGMRDQAYGDQINQQNVDFENAKAGRAEQMARYQMARQAQAQDFGRNSKLAELLMMHQALTDAQQKKSAMRQIFEEGVGTRMADLGDEKGLKEGYLKELEKTGGDPAMMAAAKKAYDAQLDEIRKTRGNPWYWPSGFWGNAPSQQQPLIPYVPNSPRSQWANPFAPYWYQGANR